MRFCAKGQSCLHVYDDRYDGRNNHCTTKKLSSRTWGRRRHGHRSVRAHGGIGCVNASTLGFSIVSAVKISQKSIDTVWNPSLAEGSRADPKNTMADACAVEAGCSPKG